LFRYTKALEVLRKQKKEYSQQIKELDLTLKHAQTHRDNAHRVCPFLFLFLVVSKSYLVFWLFIRSQLRKEVEDIENKIKIIESEISKITTEINENENQKLQLHSTLESMKELVTEINKLVTVKEQLSEQVHKLRQCLPEELSGLSSLHFSNFTIQILFCFFSFLNALFVIIDTFSSFVECKESDEDLKRMLKSFHCELEETKQQEQNLTEKLQKLHSEKTNLEKRYNQICEEFGKLTFSLEVRKFFFKEKFKTKSKI
jgi:chromosome segregation ATPase